MVREYTTWYLSELRTPLRYLRRFGPPPHTFECIQRSNRVTRAMIQLLRIQPLAFDHPISRCVRRISSECNILRADLRMNNTLTGPRPLKHLTYQASCEYVLVEFPTFMDSDFIWVGIQYTCQKGVSVWGIPLGCHISILGIALQLNHRSALPIRFLFARDRR